MVATLTNNSGQQLKSCKHVVPMSLLGTGMAVPSNVVVNRYFSDVLGLDTTAEWIEQKTGIRERRHAPPEMSVVDLAIEAALRAMENSLCAPDELSLIIVATSSSPYRMPSVGCLVQEAVGAVNAAAWDVSAACAGFAVATDIASRFLATGSEKVLVIGADCGSRMTDPKDRLSSIFFGDGAGAALFGAEGSGELLASLVSSKGDLESLSVPVDSYMTMDGKAIWNFATKVLPETIQQLCDQAGFNVGDIDLIVPHQANTNMFKHSAEVLEIPYEKFAVNLDRFGNLMGASIPVALAECHRGGRLSPGSLVATVGFGAGLCWGGQLFRI